MKILHTADVHLQQEGDERWDALEQVVALGRAQEVGLLAISGDLFDAEVDAEALRPALRALLGGHDFPVLLLPGNHDQHAYRPGFYFGENVHVLTEAEPVSVGQVMLVGLPYRDLRGERLVARLRQAGDTVADADTSILLYHGELLDALPVDTERADFGPEGPARHMPVALRYFEDVPVDYVLAGHFHSRFQEWALPGGGFFVYSGSPVSITRRETGRRAVNLFSVGEPPRAQMLDTPHFERVHVRLDPFAGGDPAEAVRGGLDRAHPAAKILLEISGYMDGADLGRTEEELAAELEALAVGCAEFTFAVRDVSRLVGTSLFAEFRQRAEQQTDSPDRREELTRIALRAMTEAGL
ncbi:MAG: metallophosphoesterase [Candidatus Brocadiia bacterium]